MSQVQDSFWAGRLEHTAKALGKNGFEAFVAADAAQAKDIILKDLVPALTPSSVSFGGSMTIVALGLMDAFKAMPGVRVIDTYDTSIPPAENIERRRQGLLTDLFLTSANAVTEEGHLVNLDGTGNRVAALTFGPRNVVVLAGRNKICTNIVSAFERIRSLAAPLNNLRLSRKTPCVKTGKCEDCGSPERICNTWVITQKSAPKGRTRVILINQDLGY